MAQQDEYYYQIELTNKKLIFYFIAGAFALILSFLAGVMVGRGLDRANPERAVETAGMEERIVTEATPTPTAKPPSPEDLTYTSRLESGRVDDTLEKPQRSPLPRASTEPSARRRPTPARTRSAAPAPESTTAAPRPAESAAPEAAHAEESAGGAESPATPTTASDPTGKPGATTPQAAAKPGSFAIQVGAFKDRATANSVAAQLKSKGFSAYVAQPGRTERLFNVRVGSFADRADAERVQKQLRDAERFKPFIVKN